MSLTRLIELALIRGSFYRGICCNVKWTLQKLRGNQAAQLVCHHSPSAVWTHGEKRQEVVTDPEKWVAWNCGDIAPSQSVCAGWGTLTTAAEATVDVWKATACRAPRGESASQQSDGGFRVGRAQGLGFLLHCQENDLLGHGCRLPPRHSPIPNWYSSILMYNACLILTAVSAFISSSPLTSLRHCQMDQNSWTHTRSTPMNFRGKKNPIFKSRQWQLYRS